MALNGDTLVVGAPYDDGYSGYSGCTNCGAIYIFTRSGSSWSLQKRIADDSTVTGFTATTLNTNDYFGYSVALDGDTLAVGAYGDDGSSSNRRYGAVYVFTRSGSTWSLEDEISNTDHSDNTGFESNTLNRNDYFGESVALSGNTLAVGAYGDDGSGCSSCGSCLYLYQKWQYLESRGRDIQHQP